MGVHTCAAQPIFIFIFIYFRNKQKGTSIAETEFRPGTIPKVQKNSSFLTQARFARMERPWRWRRRRGDLNIWLVAGLWALFGKGPNFPAQSSNPRPIWTADSEDDVVGNELRINPQAGLDFMTAHSTSTGVKIYQFRLCDSTCQFVGIRSEEQTLFDGFS